MTLFTKAAPRWLLLVSMLCMSLVPASSMADTPAQQFDKALESYDSGNYPDSISKLQGLQSFETQSPEIYYNLGNAYYRNGQVGHAIFAYRQAEVWAPRDADIQANLEHLRAQTTDKWTESSGDIKTTDLLFWYGSLSLEEHVQLAIVLNALAWGSLLLRTLRSRKDWPLQVPLLFIVAFVVTGTGIYKQYELQHKPSAVILHSEVTGRSDTNPKSVVLFYLHEGAEVRVSGEAQGDWIQVLLPDQRRGWVQKDFVGVVHP